jgi:hypothetical protein
MHAFFMKIEVSLKHNVPILQWKSDEDRYPTIGTIALGWQHFKVRIEAEETLDEVLFGT